MQNPAQCDILNEYDPASVLHFAVNPGSFYPWKGEGWTLTLADVDPQGAAKAQKEESLDDILGELDNLIGMNSVKVEVRKMTDFCRISREREKAGMKNATALWPLRIAISGMMSTPGGAIEIAWLLGKDECLRRIDLGIQKLA